VEVYKFTKNAFYKYFPFPPEGLPNS